MRLWLKPELWICIDTEGRILSLIKKQTQGSYSTCSEKQLNSAADVKLQPDHKIWILSLRVRSADQRALKDN